MSSDAEGGGELAESRIEAERQRREDHVVRGIAEVVADALGAGDEVSMAEYDSLGPPGAAGGVQDGGHVGVDGVSGGNVALGSSRPRRLPCIVCPAQARKEPDPRARHVRQTCTARVPRAAEPTAPAMSPGPGQSQSRMI